MQYKTATSTFVNWHCISKENFWTEAAILRIIRDEQYTGSTVYGRRYYDIIGQSHSVKVSKKDWIIVPDVHEPIVSREDFDRAQAALKEYKERDVVTGPKTKVRCGGCGHAMERKKAKEPYYIEDFDEQLATALMADKKNLEQQMSQLENAQQEKANTESRLDEIFTILEGLANHPMEYDDRLVRQVLECIVVESKEKIKVIFVGGLEVEQTIPI